ncbi:MAG: putative manganese transporter [Eubacteriales bacterium]|nr:putative manganese transporter [Eubacteriales bacterium]
MILDALLDAVLDSLRALPFLLAAFALMEMMEKHSDRLASKLFNKFRKTGPIAGALLGLLPQCGFSAAMSNFYAAGIVTLGTLIAVFLSTSDEAVLIMLSSPSSVQEIIPLLTAKFIIALVFGFAVDLIFRNRPEEPDIEDLCVDCGCHESKGILGPVLIHTRKIITWLLLISFILNLIFENISPESLAELLGSNLFLQPLITALIGLIPNCAVSVMFTKLYLAGSLSFASTIAGLSSGAGLGLIVLFRMEPDKKEAAKIAALLYACAAIAGIVLNLLA